MKLLFDEDHRKRFVKTRCRIIWLKKWYIVDTHRLDADGRPRMLRKEFDNRRQVQMNLDKFFPGNLRFDIIRGDEALDLGLQITNASPNLQTYLHKYGYENYMTTRQERKSYRTKFRRQNRNKKGELYKKWG